MNKKERKWTEKSDKRKRMDSHVGMVDFGTGPDHLANFLIEPVITGSSGATSDGEAH